MSDFDISVFKGDTDFVFLELLSNASRNVF